MADPRQTKTRRAALSYDQLKRITEEGGNKWPSLLINDYQGILQDWIFLADDADDIDLRVSTNEEDILTNADNIQTNADDISTNAGNITTNTTNITTNATDIQDNTDNFNTHNNSSSQHGVTGDNVGTEDFCTTLIGGVVLLSELVNNAVNSTQQITIVDLLAAPAAYDQTYTQLVTDLANDTKAKHNQLVLDLNAAIAQINDLIAKAKTAKQMVV